MAPPTAEIGDLIACRDDTCDPLIGPAHEHILVLNNKGELPGRLMH